VYHLESPKLNKKERAPETLENDVVIPIAVQQKMAQGREKKERDKRMQNLPAYLKENPFYISVIFLFYFLVVAFSTKALFQKER